LVVVVVVVVIDHRGSGNGRETIAMHTQLFLGHDLINMTSAEPLFECSFKFNPEVALQITVGQRTRTN
jgi:hypothetical protein